MLTPESPYESFESVSYFPAIGEVDTYYLNGETITGDEDPPTHGDLYLWNGSSYEFYATLQDNSFLGPRPNHPPHHN